MISNLLTYNIHSANRIPDGSDTDNFNYNILIPFDVLNQLTHVSVTQMFIPRSYYDIDTPFNTFQLREGASTVSITVPPGNYSLCQFIPDMQALLNANSPNGYMYTVSMVNSPPGNPLCPNPNVGKLQIDVNDATMPKALIFTGQNDVQVSMGMNTGSNPFVGNNQLISPMVINLSVVQSLFLCSNIMVQENVTVNSSNILAVTNMADTIPFNYKEQTFEIIENMKEFVGRNGIFNFFITDEFNNHVQLNNIDTYFTLHIFTYTPNKYFFDKMSNYIDYKVIRQY